MWVTPLYIRGEGFPPIGGTPLRGVSRILAKSSYIVIVTLHPVLVVRAAAAVVVHVLTREVLSSLVRHGTVSSSYLNA